jgi:VWFA-related protein
VTRILIDARVFDDRGHPITDLTPSDFVVRIAGRAARVESAEWVGDVQGEPPRAPAGDAAGRDRRDTTGSVPPGRLVVFLVQKDLEPSRIVGLMRLAQLVDRMLQPFSAHDRVAVLSFDSRLRIWSDFTNDFDRIRAGLARDVLLTHPRQLEASRGPSLMPWLDERAAGLSSMEETLRHIAVALHPLPGAKSLVLLGYGFGHWTPAGVVQTLSYGQAVVALQRARVSVFTLNVTQAHYNSLQAGLQAVAAQTGGTYASTYEFPAAAVQRVARALAGHYVLFVEKPDLGEGVHRIDVRLASRPGRVIARASYVERR